MKRLPGKVSSRQVSGRLHRPGAKPLDMEQALAQTRNTRAKRSGFRWKVKEYGA